MKTRLILAVLLAGLMGAGCQTIEPPLPAPEPIVTEESTPVTTGFLDRTIVLGEHSIRYVLYVPREYDGREAWPLIVFLHGAGERGKDGLIPTEVGIGSAIRRHPDRFPALVLFPQCPENKFWDVAIPAIEAQMATTRREFNIDPGRQYLTGLSMGGYGSWIWGATMTDTFAAIVPICGGGSIMDLGMLTKLPLTREFPNLQERVEKLATVPIWAFHGADDETVPAERSRKIVELVKEAGGDVQYTEFPDTGHNSWDQAYRDPALMKWLLKQEKALSR